LFHGHEPATPTLHPGLLMARPRSGDAKVIGHAMFAIETACRAGNRRVALAQLALMVPEFAPTEQGLRGSL
jgi:hypothetical protein